MAGTASDRLGWDLSIAASNRRLPCIITSDCAACQKIAPCALIMLLG
jgi:hypothetical protein